MTLLRLSCGAALIVAVGCSNVSHHEDGVDGGGGVFRRRRCLWRRRPPARERHRRRGERRDAARRRRDRRIGWGFRQRRTSGDRLAVRGAALLRRDVDVDARGGRGPVRAGVAHVHARDRRRYPDRHRRVDARVLHRQRSRRRPAVSGPGITFGSWGSGTWAVTYADGLTVMLAADGTLTGTGQGTGTTYYSDTAQSGPITASLAGGPDTVAPELSVTSDGPADNPFSSLTVSSPEALPLGATPRLVADGFASAFSPATSNGDFTTSFYGAAVFRPYGRTYTVAVDGIADFAGHPATATGATSFTTRPAPPLVPEDGFESATGTTLGGVHILSGAVAIAGTRSLYIPPTSGGPFFGTASPFHAARRAPRRRARRYRGPFRLSPGVRDQRARWAHVHARLRRGKNLP